jgi:hypothetical protein
MAQLDLVRINEGRRHAEEISGLHFSVWVGSSDGQPRAEAERLHAALPDPDHSVYLACDLAQHTLEVVTGASARQTLTDEECREATRAMREVLKDGDITDAVVLGLTHLSTYAVA